MTEVTAPPEEGQGEATPAGGWTERLGDDRKGYVENKGWKGVEDVVDSYQNLEKLRGVPEDRLLKLPDDPSAEGAMDDIYSKLGRPETADKYTRVVENAPDEVFNSLANVAHKFGVSDDGFKAMQEVMVNSSTEVLAAQETQAVEAFDKWKSSNAEGFNAAARVMATVGVDEDGLSGILAGDKASMYDFLAKVASRSSEGKIVDGDPPQGGFDLSPEAAKLKRSEKYGDKSFMDRYTNTDAKVREAAIAEMAKLNEIIAKG